MAGGVLPGAGLGLADGLEVAREVGGSDKAFNITP